MLQLVEKLDFKFCTGSFFNFFFSNSLALFFNNYGVYYIFFLKFDNIYNNTVLSLSNFSLLVNFFLKNNLLLGRLAFRELFVDGVYYRVKYYKSLNVLGFLLGYNHYVLFYLPDGVYARVHMKKRKFFLYGYDNEFLSTVSAFVVSFKYPSLYIGKGLKLKNAVYRKKIVKKKKKR
jgi:hypothetical protein